MKQMKRLLFPVDFSSHCERVDSEVFAMVRKLDAEIVLLHVLDSASNSVEQNNAALNRLHDFGSVMPDGVRWQ
jgi:nucleotide-binding universal stress UspA family protein